MTSTWVVLPCLKLSMDEWSKLVNGSYHGRQRKFRWLDVLRLPGPADITSSQSSMKPKMCFPKVQGALWIWQIQKVAMATKVIASMSFNGYFLAKYTMFCASPHFSESIQWRCKVSTTNRIPMATSIGDTPGWNILDSSFKPQPNSRSILWRQHDWSIFDGSHKKPHQEAQSRSKWK